MSLKRRKAPLAEELTQSLKCGSHRPAARTPPLRAEHTGSPQGPGHRWRAGPGQDGGGWQWGVKAPDGWKSLPSLNSRKSEVRRRHTPTQNGGKPPPPIFLLACCVWAGRRCFITQCEAHPSPSPSQLSVQTPGNRTHSGPRPWSCVDSQLGRALRSGQTAIWT